MTFSIVAWDPDAQPTPEWGVAVASKFLAVGSLVGWARAGVGAVATQALANATYGPHGLELLERGRSADEVLGELTGADDQREVRQLGVVDARGAAATFTGSECFEWAGGRAGDGYCCQGNILTGPEVVERMAEAFETTEGELARRLIAALEAGDAAGGDRRGRQSAAVLVVRAEGGYGGGTDVTVDLRVDDHAAPVTELWRLYELQSLYFPRPDELEFLDVDESLRNEISSALSSLGYEPTTPGSYDDPLVNALYEFSGTENLEERWSEDGRIERRVLEYLRERARS